MVGVSGAPTPLVKGAESAAWRRDSGANASALAWASYFMRDDAATAALRAELRALDPGDDSLTVWATAASPCSEVAAEVQWPPQGPPKPPPGTQYALLPDIYAVPDPLPLTSQMLARLPPQALPPGPLPTKATQLLKGWACRLIFDTAAAIAAREAYFFAHPPSSTDKSYVG